MDEMSVDMPGHTSQSTSKPKVFVEACAGSFEVRKFEPVTQSDFYYAHRPAYVDGFFSGTEPHASSSGFEWSESYAESQKYTVGSLYAAIRHVLVTRQMFAIAPISGFHHATPKGGKMFCSFSGQVIASVKTYINTRAVGAYIDLDSHYGNSIDNTLSIENKIEYLSTKVADCIKFNVNPNGTGRGYISSLRSNLVKMKEAAIAKEIDYLVYCHGADSIEGDELGRDQCTEAEWFECTRIVCEFARETKLPLVLCLFGGYGDMNRVVNLHVRDAKLINELINNK